MIKRVTIVGAGNLATQLAFALYRKGIEISQIYSRTEKSAEDLAWKVEAGYTTNIREIDCSADLCIYAVSDHALQDVLDKSLVPIGRVVHTAGSIPLDIFVGYTYNYGVFYPLQTFSKNKKVDFSNIPICIEAREDCDEDFLVDLKELGALLSGNVQMISSEERKRLHLAAVFACNFTNHMYSIGKKLLSEQGLDFNLLQPLIQETAEKVKQLDPLEAQTGPAVRFDQKVMNRHINLLKDSPDFQKMYRFVSESIYKMHKSE